MVMIKANVFEVKARLSHYLAAVERGERVVICKRNRPVAELRAIGAERSAPRPVGGASGEVVVPASFFDPLPEDVLKMFYPADEAVPLRRRPAPAARVAKRPEKPFGPTRRGRTATTRGKRR
jgi:antitoxin (DNA-binding transcriptional repressor) of toxin-antitoxin stability system